MSAIRATRAALAEAHKPTATEYEMSDEDMKKILAASRPVVAIFVGGVAPASPQENANQAWRDLGQRMGFDWQTVRPIEGRAPRFFTAIPSETESAREERLARERAETRRREADRLRAEIAERQSRLAALEDPESP